MGRRLLWLIFRIPSVQLHGDFGCDNDVRIVRRRKTNGNIRYCVLKYPSINAGFAVLSKYGGINRGSLYYKQWEPLFPNSKKYWESRLSD